MGCTLCRRLDDDTKSEEGREESNMPRYGRKNGSIAPQESDNRVASVSAADSSHGDKIRRWAYEIYLRRGGEPGHETDDWLQAEREAEDARLSIHRPTGA
jgi:hypothetical protein